MVDPKKKKKKKKRALTLLFLSNVHMLPGVHRKHKKQARHKIIFKTRDKFHRLKQWAEI